MPETEKDDNKYIIETILSQIGVGRFHVRNYAFLFFLAIIATMNNSSFVFTARDTSYRCLVPECDTNPPEFNQAWLQSALPYDGDKPKKCERFAGRNLMSVSSEVTADSRKINCDLDSFDNSTEEKCKSWVYGEGTSIANDFNIPCQPWKLSMVGTICAAGQLVSLLISGVLSDKYGRRNVMISLITILGVLGLIQSSSMNYWFFLTFEFLTKCASAGAYASAYVLAAEILSSKHRLYGCAVMTYSCVFGMFTLGFVAWVTPSWRYIFITANIPSFILVLAYWFTPESVRWLHAKGRRKESAIALREIARLNRVQLNDENIKEISKMESDAPLPHEYQSEVTIKKKIPKATATLKDIVKRPKLLLRFFICACCWFSIVLVYYGLSVNSVNISDNENSIHLNFILQASVEIPSTILYLIILNFIGRRYAMFFSMILAGLFCIYFPFIPKVHQYLAIAIYLVAKFFICLAYGILYIFTTEIFPTPLRNSCLSCCSVMGRIGLAFAPQVPLLYKVNPILPMVTYGIFPLFFSFTVLMLPESKNKKLPDTVEEAESMK